MSLWLLAVMILSKDKHHHCHHRNATTIHRITKQYHHHRSHYFIKTLLISFIVITIGDILDDGISSSLFTLRSNHPYLASSFPLSTATSSSLSSDIARKATLFSPNTKTPRYHRTMATITTSGEMSLFRLRGGGGGNGDEGAVTAKPAPPSNKKIRIIAFDSIRVLLIISIVFGHFYSFSQIPSSFLLRFFSQHNVAVGGFFALSGYVAAYTSSENNVRQVSSKVITTPKQLWILQKLFSYVPLHWFILLLFSPMFIYVDMTYNGLGTTIFNGLLSMTLLQAYFPNKGAEIWNAPTWFLSSLTLSTMCLPYILPSLCSLSKTQLVKTGLWIYMVYLLPKIGYCYDTSSFHIAESITSPKLIPNLAAFNMQRFHPFMNIAEVLLGIIACRIVMLDGEKKDDDSPIRKTNALSTLVPATMLFGFFCFRSWNQLWPMSDLIARSVIFVPMFLRFIMACHRQTVAAATTNKNSSDIVLSLLSSPLLVALSTYVFPIFLVHGPIGQVFYKKLIATKLWGKVLYGPAYFGLYLIVTFAAAYLLQTGFVQNVWIQKKTNSFVQQLSKWF